MYIQMDDIADVIHKYLIQRSRYSVEFALKVESCLFDDIKSCSWCYHLVWSQSAWLLSANLEDQRLESQCQRRAARLLKFILSEELRPRWVLGFLDEDLGLHAEKQ